MAKTIINARVIDQALLLENLPTLASGGVNEIQVNFSFCDLWTGATKKTAVFFRNPVEVHHAELTDGACTAPWEVFAAPGTVHMGVFAEYADGTTRTCEALPLTVAQGAITTQTAAPNAPNIYAALEQQVSDLKNSMETDVQTVCQQVLSVNQKINSIANFPEASANLFNKDDVTIQNGVYIDQGGHIVALTVDRHMVTHKIAVEPNTTYVMGYTGQYAANSLGGFYNSSGVWIANIVGSVVGNNECFSFTVPDNPSIAYALLNQDMRKIDTLMVVEGSTYPAEYIAYVVSTEKVLKDDVLLNEKQLIQAKDYVGADRVFEQVNAIIEVVETTNLFNKDSVENKAGYLLARGNETALSGYGYSHPIAVQDGNTYYVTKSGDVGHGYVATVYDANGSVLKGTTIGTVPANIHIDETDEYWYFTIPDGLGASYMRCSYKEVKIGAFMVAETDAAPTGYMPYVESKTVIKDSALPLLVRTINGISPDENGNISADITSPLYGKKLAVNGDSICYGAGATGGYGAYIAANNNMTLQNIGVSGATIAAEVSRDDGTFRHCISRTIANMDADADYAIVEGGVNDSSLAVPLGAITADYGDALDDTTFYGAFESMLKQLLIRFAGKKIGYIAVHQMSTNFRASNDKETSYYWAAKLCCEKWGVPFLDLNTTVPPFGLIRNITGQADLYAATRAAYTANGDGWHPNEEGYQKYYVPKIEAWLKTL